VDVYFIETEERAGPGQYLVPQNALVLCTDCRTHARLYVSSYVAAKGYSPSDLRRLISIS